MSVRKKPEKHSYLDLFLVLFVALVLVGSGVRSYGLRVFVRGSEQAPFLVELESAGVDAMAADCLSVGEELYLSDGSLFGSVSAIETFPLKESIFENGKAYAGEWDTGLRCRIRVRVVCMGSEREGVFLFSGKTPLGIGETLTLIGKKSELGFRIVSARLGNQ